MCQLSVMCSNAGGYGPGRVGSPVFYKPSLSVHLQTITISTHPSALPPNDVQLMPFTQ